MNSLRSFRAAAGYTMIEILVAVTLSLIIMLAITQLFSKVNGAMNDAQGSLLMTRNLSNVKFRLERDLRDRSYRTITPLGSTDGYFCVMEGPMWQPVPDDLRFVDMAHPVTGPRRVPLARDNDLTSTSTLSEHTLSYHVDAGSTTRRANPCNQADCPWCSTNTNPLSASIAENAKWCSTNIAMNEQGESGNDAGVGDNTVGDTDDILMFTLYSTGKFRGCVPTISNGELRLTIVESATAEVAWFLRGNTLYRRMLLVGEFQGHPGRYNGRQITNFEILKDHIRDEIAGRTGQTIVCHIRDRSFTLSLADYDRMIQNGYGFYTLFDLSVRPDSATGPLVANSMQSLQRRENRFAHSNINNSLPFPFNLHNVTNTSTAAWYFLRLPTMTETTYLDNTTFTDSWRAGNGVNRSLTLNRSWWKWDGTYPSTIDNCSPETYDATQIYNWTNTVAHSGGDQMKKPYMDQWNDPSPWNYSRVSGSKFGVDKESGSLAAFLPDASPRAGQLNRGGEDVMMTNVISFDVKVWSEELSRYVDLGESGKYHDQQRGNATHDSLFSDVNPASGRADDDPTMPVNQRIGRFPLHSKGRYATGAYWTYDDPANIGNQAINPFLHAPPHNNQRDREWPPQGVNQNDYLMSSVYDTWTYEYESVVASTHWYNYATPAGTAGAGAGDPYHLWACPPPYDEQLKAIQVTLRCFDPRSKSIREMKIVRDLTQ